MRKSPENRLLYSGHFLHGVWEKQAATVTPSSGAANAYKLAASPVDNCHIIGQSVAGLLDHGAYTASVLVKADEERYAYVEIVVKYSHYVACFSLIDGSYSGRWTGQGGAEPAAKGSVDMGDGWWRIYVTAVGKVTQVFVGVRNTAGNFSNTFVGDGFSGVHISAFQLERTSGQEPPSPYTPTTRPPIHRLHPIAAYRLIRTRLR